MKCKICNAVSEKIFTTTVLQKYTVGYFKCTNCGFMQTENPYWLDEAYSSAIASLDIGLLHRNIFFQPYVINLINNYLYYEGAKYLDYGGGYGVFTRLMRDAGFHFFRQDIYCENMFAKHFDINDLPEDEQIFTLATIFEVFEHLENPLDEIQEMAKYSKEIFFSTVLQPEGDISPNNWWYIVPETGQHIAFYTQKSLEIIAETLDSYYYNLGIVHLFSSIKLDVTELKNKLGIEPKPSFLDKIMNKTFRAFIPSHSKRASLLQQDFEYVKGKSSK